MAEHLISIDAECNGLAGRAFAVAMTLSDGAAELETVVYRCPIEGVTDDWVAANVLPHIGDVEVNCADYAGLLYNLCDAYGRWAEEGARLIAHVAWPVEARLLLDMFPAADIWSGPFPLIDVASVLLAKGHDPLTVDGYLDKHDLERPDGSPHHPLYDARAAERCFRHLMEQAA